MTTSKELMARDFTIDSIPIPNERKRKFHQFQQTQHPLLLQPQQPQKRSCTPEKKFQTQFRVILNYFSKEFHCPISCCGRKYSRHSDLKSHFTLNHSDCLSEYPSLRSSGKFACAFCGINFARRKVLQLHLKRCEKRPDYKRTNVNSENNIDNQYGYNSNDNNNSNNNNNDNNRDDWYSYSNSDNNNYCRNDKANSDNASTTTEHGNRTERKNSKFSIEFLVY